MLYSSQFWEDTACRSADKPNVQLGGNEHSLGLCYALNNNFCMEIMYCVNGSVDYEVIYITYYYKFLRYWAHPCSVSFVSNLVRYSVIPDCIYNCVP
jgi:hypothetical protein